MCTEKQKLFISYGHPQAWICRRICQELEAAGFSVWFDEKQISSGKNWREEIAVGIQNSESVIAMLSRHSVRNPGVCLDELSIAIGIRNGNILSILLESEDVVRPPASLTNNQWLDMSEWNEKLNDGDDIFENWFSDKINKIIKVLKHPDTTRFVGDIEFIRKELPQIYLSTSKQASLLAKPFVGRKWLFKIIDDYLDDSEHSQLCIVFGDPGIGKSSFVAHYTHYNGRVAASIFCERGQNHFNKPSSVIQTLAFLLAGRLPDYRVVLKHYLENHSVQGLSDQELFDQLLSNLLSTQTINGNRETLAIIIDGLDECGDKDQNVFAEILVALSERLPIWLKVLAFSRKEQNVIAPAAGVAQIDLQSYDENNILDIKTYLRENLSQFISENKCSEQQLNDLAMYSGGIFLYASMIVDGILKGKMSINNVSEYPKGLSGAFTNWFRWFFPSMSEYNDYYRLPLAVLLATPDPLPIEELSRIFNWKRWEIQQFISRINVLLRHGIGWFDKETITINHIYISQWLNSQEAGVYRVSSMDGVELLADRFYESLQNNPDSVTYFESIYLKDLLIKSGKTQKIHKIEKQTTLTKSLCLYDCYINLRQIETRENITWPYWRGSVDHIVCLCKLTDILDRVGRYSDSLIIHSVILNDAVVAWNMEWFYWHLENIIWESNRYAKCLEMNGNYREALKYYIDAFNYSEELACRFSGQNKSRIEDWITSLSGVLRIHRLLSQYDDAKEFYQKALKCTAYQKWRCLIENMCDLSSLEMS